MHMDVCMMRAFLQMVVKRNEIWHYPGLTPLFSLEQARGGGDEARVTARSDP